MKKYTVKEVVSLENKSRYLAKLDGKNLADEYFLPLALIWGVGAAFTSFYFTGENRELQPLIIGGLSQLLGGGLLAYFISAGKRFEWVQNKLDRIYDIMGKDFEKAVYNEMYPQELGNASRSK